MIKIVRLLLLLNTLVASSLLIRTPVAESQSPIRVGIIDTDTSHATAFTQMLNDPSRPDHVPGARVVSAFKGGSPDVTSSAIRVERFAAEFKDKWKVEFVNSVEALCRRVDAVLLESVDGRSHLEQVRPVFAAKKRVFIDKPLAASLHDVREIARLSRDSGTPFLMSSSLRFVPEIEALKNKEFN